LIDLHSHSNVSDGSDSPVRVVEMAAAVGVSALALTDHDSLAGVPAATDAARTLGLELIPGTELSVNWEGGAMHLVVLFLSTGSGPLQDRLGEIQAGRSTRNLVILEKLAALGFPVTIDEVMEEGGAGSIGRPHIAAVMMKRGYVATLSEAFDLYLGFGRPAYAPRWRLDPAEAIELALQSKAVPVLAHPHTLALDSSARVAETLTFLKQAGLVGMECHYSVYSPLEREGYTALASRFGLLASGGSDYHGTYKPGIELGRGRGDLQVPAHLLDDLRPR
jgi:predicted metal-dependent phosphoesterase TrpH